MKVSLANLLKTQQEKMSVFTPEQKFMKTNEFSDSVQMLIITNGLTRCQGGEVRASVTESALETPFFATALPSGCKSTDHAREKYGPGAAPDPSRPLPLGFCVMLPRSTQPHPGLLKARLEILVSPEYLAFYRAEHLENHP